MGMEKLQGEVRKGSAWGELPDSILSMVLRRAAPENRAAVNLVNRHWRSQHATVVQHLRPRVWDSVWISSKFPHLVSLSLEEFSIRPPRDTDLSIASQPEAGEIVDVCDTDLLGLAPLRSLKALAFKSSGMPSASTNIISSVSLNVIASNLKSLEALRIDRSQMTGCAMAALGSMTGLRCLHLKEQTNRDEHLAHIGKLTSLTSLYLEGCCIGNIGINAFSALTSLRTLCISSARTEDAEWDVRVTDAGIRCLSALPNLQALDLDCCGNIEGHGLTGLTGVRSLGLSKMRGLTRQGVRACLAALTGLTGLDLLDCPHLLGQQGMELWTQPIPSLRSLRLCRMLANEVPTVYKLAALAREGHLTNLRTLWLSACDQEDLPNLIGPSQLSDDGLIHLASLTSIKSLCLSCNCNITCVGLSFLVSGMPLYPTDVQVGQRNGLRCLEELDLTACEHVADMGVSWLALHLTNLQVLSLAECRVTDACLPFFSRLVNLRELSFKGCRHITDAGMEHLVALKSLRELHLGCLFAPDMRLDSDCPLVTDAGLEKLALLSSLTVLSLAGCVGVTHLGAALLLTRVTSLVALDLRHTAVHPSFATDVVHPQSLTRHLNVKLGCRLLVEGLSDVFDLVARPMYKHCINPPHDWTGACHEVPCDCNELWSRARAVSPEQGDAQE